MPLTPSLPSLPLMPSTPSLPSLPLMPLTPSLPSVPLMPSMPFLPSLPLMPLTPSLPSAPAAPVISARLTRSCQTPPVVRHWTWVAVLRISTDLPSTPFTPFWPFWPSAPFWPSLPSAPFWPFVPFWPLAPVRSERATSVRQLSSPSEVYFHWMAVPLLRSSTVSALDGAEQATSSTAAASSSASRVKAFRFFMASSPFSLYFCPVLRGSFTRSLNDRL